MPLELGFKAIDEAVLLGAEWISITGGEPLLYSDMATTLIEYASRKGCRTEIVSNGFWAETPRAAQELLERLDAAGLEALNLSIDDFHQEYVTLSSLRYAYEAAKSLGIKIILLTTTTKNNRITAETIPGLLGDEKIQVLGASRVRDPNALLVETPVTPVEPVKNIHDYEYTLITRLQCGEVLRDIGVGPGGDIYPCCGPLASKLSLGNINETSLKAMLDKAERDPFFVPLMEGVEVSGAFTSKCHACISLVENRYNPLFKYTSTGF